MNQFQSLQPWIFQILNEIKKDIKTEHLGADPVFYKTYFGNRPQNRLTAEEIFAGYEKELVKGNEELAEWVVNRWVFKHGDLYRHFAERLSDVHPDFSQIKELNEEESEKVLDGASDVFGAVDTFLFSVLNGVVFSEKVIQRLRKEAEAEAAAQKKEVETPKVNLEQMVAQHQREVARLHAKIEGVQKKYTTDVEALKKQIRALQKKVQV
ncbi:MAG TPA: hypothetical protein VLE89_05240 [Chlamydiales bacterium]|nr:hypothetical protein [Chlamydiales bacterium]